MIHRRLAPLVLCLAPLAAQTPKLDFAQTVTFGDSLTANDLLGFPFKMWLYGKDPMEATFRKAAPTGSKLTSYAIPGTRAEHILAEIAAYATRYTAKTQKLATLISFEIGGNDILGDFARFAANPPGKDKTTDAKIDKVIQRIFADMYLLYIAHPKANFVVWTVPDVTYTPKHWDKRGDARGANCRAHVARINRWIRWMGTLPRIAVLDTEALVRQVGTNPPVLNGKRMVGAPSYGKRHHVFADHIHPTAATNLIVANAIADALNKKHGVSLPKYSDAEIAREAGL